MMLAREQLREHALAPGMEFNEGFTFFLSNEVFFVVGERKGSQKSTFLKSNKRKSIF